MTISLQTASSFRSMLCFASALSFLFLASTAFAQVEPPDKIPLSGLLLPDGTVDLSGDNRGTIDPAGFRFVSGRKGAPTFAAESSVSSDGAWHSVGTGEANGLNGIVNALAVIGRDLFVGGEFTEAGGSAAHYIARWDGSAWHSLGTDAANGVGDHVRDLAVSGSDLYVGGLFSDAGGQPAFHVARWDGANWHSLGTGITAGVDNGVNARVYALAASETDMYAGGLISQAGGSAANAVARWDGTEWHSMGTGVTGTVTALAVSGSDVFVGGQFWKAGGHVANHIARWDGGAWQILPGSGGGSPGLFHPQGTWVRDMAVNGSDLYVAGQFIYAGGGDANNIARWDGSSWHPLGEGLNSTGRGVAVLGSDVFVGGWFTTAGGQAANRVARWDGSGWSPLGGDGANGVNAWIRAVAVSDSDLYVGGEFTMAGGQAANHVARWSAAGVSTDPDGGTVQAFALSAPFPNPFMANTTISFAVSEAATVRLEAYDLLGRRVDVLLDDQVRQPGQHEVTWQPAGLAPGVYMVRLTSGGFSETRRVVLMR
jgi:hypothetical protein